VRPALGGLRRRTAPACRRFRSTGREFGVEHAGAGERELLRERGLAAPCGPQIVNGSPDAHSTSSPLPQMAGTSSAMSSTNAPPAWGSRWRTGAAGESVSSALAAAISSW
jgi:hypothetical protein